jgi:hypothetical protein
MSRREIENEDEDDDILGSWRFMVTLFWKVYLNTSLVYSDHVGTVYRCQLNEKNEITEIAAMKKIDMFLSSSSRLPHATPCQRLSFPEVFVVEEPVRQ